MQRLGDALLPKIVNLPHPLYSRPETKSGIVHIGAGAFHRAHQAYYTEQVMNLFGGDWQITACSLRSSDVKNQLEPQDGLYTLLERSESNQAIIIGAIKKILVGPENPAAIIQAIANKSTHIVSLTITEKGYCHQPASGALNRNHPDIQHDLQHIKAPRSAIGFIVAGLIKRFEENTPLSIMSCDNLPNNGDTARKVILEFASLLDPKLEAWVATNVSFPNSMVDRITPATTESDIAEFQVKFGYLDQGLVVAEPFSQWVIEDRFAGPRPPWEKVGVLMVKDVTAYETMKLRLLNGCHSLLAYSGYLAGYKFINEAMKDERFAKLSLQFMNTVAKTFKAPEGFDVSQYQRQLIERFANPGLKHRTWQIAMDGSQKIPQRWLGSLDALLHNEEDCSILFFALASWMRFCFGRDEQGNPIEISDPLAAKYQAIVEQCGQNTEQYVRCFIELQEVFSTHHSLDTRIIQGVTLQLNIINKQGIQAALKNITQQQQEKVL